MGKLLSVVRSLKMTSAIAALVLCSIVCSIGSVSAVIYVSLHERSMEDTRAQQTTNIGIAATVLEKRISGSVVTWKDGEVEAFQGYAIPPFYDTEIIDAVTRVTGQEASIYVFDKPTGSYVSKTTSIATSTGERAADIALGPDDALFDTLTAGQPYVGNTTILGVNYLGAFQPLLKKSGEVMGLLFVGTTTEKAESAANELLGLVLIAGSIVTGVLGCLGYALSRLITRPIPRLAQPMREIADGNFAAKVPYLDATNEIGAMARAVDVFRQNGMKVNEMTEAERAASLQRRTDRAQMMQELQRAFGEVVDAPLPAISPSASKRAFPTTNSIPSPAA